VYVLSRWLVVGHASKVGLFIPDSDTSLLRPIIGRAGDRATLVRCATGQRSLRRSAPV